MIQRPNDYRRRFPLAVGAVPAATLVADAGVSPLVDARSPIIDDLPQAFTLSCGFNKLPTSAVQNQLPGWVDLRTISADDFGQELLLLGATVEQLAADTTGAAPGGAAIFPWGDKYGRGVGLAFGMDMTEPRRDNGWYERPFPDPSFGYNAPATWADGNLVAGAVQSGYDERILYSIGWPVGSLTDALPYQRVTTKSFAPSGFRLTRGHKLHVAFVCAPLMLNPGNTGVAGNFYGHAKIQLHFARTEGPYGFERK
jgi:hypothetical protein